MKTAKQKGAGFDPETLERAEQELQGMDHHAARPEEWHCQVLDITPWGSAQDCINHAQSTWYWLKGYEIAEGMIELSIKTGRP